jgi:hypothetical protein
MQRKKDLIKIYVGQDNNWHWSVTNKEDVVILQSTKGFELKTYCKRQALFFAKRHNTDSFDIEIQEIKPGDPIKKNAWAL